MGLVAPTKAHDFGKYTLVAKLATGGMAEIFLARLKGAAGFEKLVCVKRILPHLAKDPQLLSMFLAEAKIAAQISHPNVCSVFELGEIDGRYFIAMEYLEGVPFTCFRRPDMYAPAIDPRLVVGLGIQACEGLHHAHQLKKPDGTPLEVVHRDVSSGNLFATVAGMVKVLDFGIAKIQDTSIRTSTGSVKGTYAYMAPEQLRGEKLDRRTDLFALGTVLWELFARQHLFKKETDFLTFQAISTDPIPDLAEIRPDLPPPLCEAIARALARNREERFPTARAMGEALSKAVSMIGGPMSPGEISEEILRSFETRLDQQNQLIRIAREGGALALDDDFGPAVAHGTAMVLTPVSVESSPDLDTEPVERAPSEPALGQLLAAAATTPPRSTSVPPAPRRDLARWRLAALATIALLSIVLVAVLVLRSSGCSPAASTEDAARVAQVSDAASADAEAVILVDAPPTIPTIPIDATTPDPGPVDAAEPEEPADAAQITPPRVGPTRPQGPPGFITIDSTPYATIYIDGKKYGDTPLIRVALAPGKHRARAVSGLGGTRTFTITIVSGKVAPPHRIQW